MTFYSKVGSFVSRTSAGSQSIKGVGFTPKVLFIWSTPASGGWDINSEFSFGFAASSSQYGHFCSAGTDAVSPSQEQRRMASAACGWISGAGTFEAESTLTSFDSDGFTLNWSTVDPWGITYHYLALGGTDITNAAVVPWQQQVAGGNQSITGVGFKPDLVLHIGTEDLNAPPATTVHGCIRRK